MGLRQAGNGSLEACARREAGLSIA